LTVACAQCHDHKFDSIPTKDFYSLLGVFTSTKRYEYPDGTPEEITRYRSLKEKLDAREKILSDFLRVQSEQLGDILASRISRYLMAARKVLSEQRQTGAAVAQQDNLNPEALERWIKYLSLPSHNHPFLEPWDQLMAHGCAEEECRDVADAFQALVLDVIQAKKDLDRKNLVLQGGRENGPALPGKVLLHLDRDKVYLWKDLFFSNPQGSDSPFSAGAGILYFADRPVRGFFGGHEREVDRFLKGEWKAYVEALEAEIAEIKRRLPNPLPFVQAIHDDPKPHNERVRIHGDPQSPGDVAPRRFLGILCDSDCAPFKQGSGRLELAEAIADTKNP
jgi:hypothetical protein